MVVIMVVVMVRDLDFAFRIARHQRFDHAFERVLVKRYMSRHKARQASKDEWFHDQAVISANSLRRAFIVGRTGERIPKKGIEMNV